MKIDKLLFLLDIIIYLSLLRYSSSFLVLPFQFYNNKINRNIINSNNLNLETISGKDFLELIKTKMVTTVSLGTPFMPLDFYITMESKYSYIGKGYCLRNSSSSYNPLNSSSFSNYSWYKTSFDDLRNMTIGKDKSTFFYNDYNLKNNITINNFQLYYGTISELSLQENLNNNRIKEKICGIIGLDLHLFPTPNYNNFLNIYSILRNNNITNIYNWQIDFFKDNNNDNKDHYDGFLILGAMHPEYLSYKKINESTDIESAYVSSVINTLEWTHKFNKIFFQINNNHDNNIIKMNIYIDTIFDIDFNYIFVSKEYFNLIQKYFFQQYFDKKICRINKIKEFYLNYEFIYCDKANFQNEINNFPTLSFQSRTFKYTFNLTYEDVFKEIGNNQFLFLLIFDPWDPTIFKFGKLFLKKFQFIFQYDKRMISFVRKESSSMENLEKEKNKNNKNQDNNQINDNNDREKKINVKIDRTKLIWILVFVMLFLGIFIGIFIGKKTLDKVRKKRANELQDDYEYRADNKDINQKNDRVSAGQEVEMKRKILYDN